MQSLTDKLNWYIFSKSPILDPEHAQGCIEYASLEAQTRFGPCLLYTSPSPRDS